MYNQPGRSHVAWDIETTGFGWSEKITVSGFWFPDNHATLIINTGPHTVEKQPFEDHLSAVSDTPVSVIVTDNEDKLLSEMRQVIFERFDREYNRLVAYNAESWNGGFDLPFTRTRCIRQGVDWIFDGIVFTDLWTPVKKRLNTTYTAYGVSNSTNSLTGSYTILFNHNDNIPAILDKNQQYSWYHTSPYDPFEESGSAAAHYRRGDVLPVCEHNLADVHRTWELGEIVREYVSSKNFSEKKL